MTEGAEFENLSELEAAIVLYAATVVADGEVHAKETEELEQHIRLLVGGYSKDGANLEERFFDFLQHLSSQDSRSLLRLSQRQVRLIAGMIESDDLKIQVMNAIFEIAYSDDHYHDLEREIVGVLRECWGV